MITEQKLNEIFEEVKAFERSNWGTRYGFDFPALAKLLMTNKHFDAVLKKALIASLLLPLNLHGRADLEGGDPDKILREIGGDSPLQQLFAEVFYIGYRAGRTDAEIDHLHNLTNTQKVG